jgi:hypothetical protein
MPLGPEAQERLHAEATVTDWGASTTLALVRLMLGRLSRPVHKSPVSQATVGGSIFIEP